jgi:Transglutaminase-like superfamily/Carbohydrate family 9 binding domain-like
LFIDRTVRRDCDLAQISSHPHSSFTITFAMKSSWIARALAIFALLSDIQHTARADNSGDWELMQSIVPRGYRCGLTDSPIVVDGKLDDASWQAAPWTKDFVDIEGGRKPLPAQRTRVKMLWDKDHLYIAADLEERHLQGLIEQHDAVIFQDNDFELFIDPDGDNHEYYELELNALNTTWDLFLPRPYKDGGSADNAWEFAGLRTAVDIRGTLNDPADIDQGWSVEIAIPWSAFRQQSGVSLPPRDGDRWRINYSRVQWQFDVVDNKYVKRANIKEDNWVWSPPGIVDMHRPERWGIVEFCTRALGDDEFAHDSSLQSRDKLMEVYHRQRFFHSQQGRWAASWQELGFSSNNDLSLELTLTPEGYQASLQPRQTDGRNTTWYVRQDSKIWSIVQNQSVSQALERASDNRAQLELALKQVVDEHRASLEFLIANMPDRDLQSLTAAFLLENVQLAETAHAESPWKESIPNEVFLNNVLPYANINEGRDPWRKEFRKLCLPLIQGAKTTTQAATLLNQRLFPLLNVKYSTQRAKADQNPNESIKSGLASCTGLSVLLIDACRSVGVPARFVGTPLWSDNSGNHSWVEIWDDGWHFTGAAEPTGNALDQAWFTGRAATALRDNPMKAIYAVSFQRTPLTFPLVWNRSINYVHAVNVTDRYTALGAQPSQGTATVWFKVLDSATRERVAANVRVVDSAGKEYFAGKSKDDRFDSNDHLVAYLPVGQEFVVEVALGENRSTQAIEVKDQPITVSLVIESPNQ